MKRVCVFCGSNAGIRREYLESARTLGLELVRRGLGLVYGGGTVGMMGALARAASRPGGGVIGVMPRRLLGKEAVGSTGVTELRVVETMHERKALMADLADGFIALPGGLGTLDELFEIGTWAQLGIHHKPVGLLNVSGYFDDLIAFLDHAVTEEFVSAIHRVLLMVESSPSVLLDRFERHRPPSVQEWAGPGER